MKIILISRKHKLKLYIIFIYLNFDKISVNLILTYFCVNQNICAIKNGIPKVCVLMRNIFKVKYLVVVQQIDNKTKNELDFFKFNIKNIFVMQFVTLWFYKTTL